MELVFLDPTHRACSKFDSKSVLPLNGMGWGPFRPCQLMAIDTCDPAGASRGELPLKETSDLSPFEIDNACQVGLKVTVSCRSTT